MKKIKIKYRVRSYWQIIAAFAIVLLIIFGLQIQNAIQEKNSNAHDSIVRENGKREREPSAGDEEQSQGKAPDIEMVFVEGGTFMMGCTKEQGSDCWDDEKPAHQVTLSSYYIGKYEVTQAQWVAVMGKNPSTFKGDQLPVNKVNWNDAQEFIRRLNSLTGKQYRLPTEAEWEFAARGGNNSRGYKYSGSNTVGDVAWYAENSRRSTHPVGTKQPNELGIYDMSGNVSEWCNDWYGDYTDSPQTDPKGPSSGTARVRRSSTWLGGDKPTKPSRVSFRYGEPPDYRGSTLHWFGFRLAQSSE